MVNFIYLLFSIIRNGAFGKQIHGFPTHRMQCPPKLEYRRSAQIKFLILKFISS